jgi:aminoglycoside phosphotransferase (APT) family kinase protein
MFDVSDLTLLLRQHLPAFADLPCYELASSGTDNSLFKLGDTYLLRIPRRSEAVRPLQSEIKLLPKLQNLPLAVPTVLVAGALNTHVPFAVYRWIPGQNADADGLTDPVQSARQLAEFLGALHKVDSSTGPLAGPNNNMRGVPLARLDQATLEAISVLADEIDVASAKDIWSQALGAAPATQMVWIHGDLKSDNMLLRHGQLRAVIDWGLAGVGDPAVDYAAGLTWVPAEAEATFRECLLMTEADWLRARGWALYCAVIALSYYRGRSHPALCAHCRRILSRLGLLL